MPEPASDPDPTDTAPPPPEPDEAQPSEPRPPRMRGGFDLERSRITPELVEALLKAQREAKPVGKEGWNKQQEYAYALADAMIGEGRRALNCADIVWLCANREIEPPQTALGSDKMWITSTVVTESLLLHVDSDKSVSQLMVIAELDAIGMVARPTDKAACAAATMSHAYIARDMLGIARTIQPEGDVNERVEPEDQTERGGRQEQRRRDAGPTADFNRERKRALDVWKIYSELVRQRDGARPDPLAWQDAHLGHQAQTTEDYKLLAHLIGEQIAIIRDDAGAP